MEITTQLLDQLISEGITADTHHATVKSVAGQITGSKISSGDYKEIREALQNRNTEDDVATVAEEVPVKDEPKAEPKAKKSKASKSKAEPKAKVEKEPMSEAQRSKTAKQIVKERAGDPDMPGWENVEKVVETSDEGLPLRVVVKCVDPQENAKCEKRREINAQDVFQVQRCKACQKRHTQNYRNELARRRRAEAKA